MPGYSCESIYIIYTRTIVSNKYNLREADKKYIKPYSNLYIDRYLRWYTTMYLYTGCLTRTYPLTYPLGTNSAAEISTYLLKTMRLMGIKC